MTYAERIMELLDANPGKEYTLRQIQVELNLPIRPWEPTLYVALRRISKMYGYNVRFTREASITRNRITALYSANKGETEPCQTKPL